MRIDKANPGFLLHGEYRWIELASCWIIPTMEQVNAWMAESLPREFFHASAVDCARRLLGCRLLWGPCAGVIVETEAYEEFGDEACHTASRPTARKFLAEHPAGSAYVYLNYGMHWMLNVSTAGRRGKGFVLLRALEPTSGIRQMQRRRRKGKVTQPPKGMAWLCSGPGKLACALGVGQEHHGLDLCAGNRKGFLPPTREVPLKATPRIGISKAVDLPWRFVWKGHPCLSRA